MIHNGDDDDEEYDEEWVSFFYFKDFHNLVILHLFQVLCRSLLSSHAFRKNCDGWLGDALSSMV